MSTVSAASENLSKLPSFKLKHALYLRYVNHKLEIDCKVIWLKMCALQQRTAIRASCGFVWNAMFAEAAIDPLNAKCS